MTRPRQVSHRKKPTTTARHSAGVSGGKVTVAPDTHTTVSLVEEWDSDGYLGTAHPDRLQIPQELGGEYVLIVTVQWLVADHLLPVAVSFEQESRAYFYTYLQVNGQPLGNQARATANRVTGAQRTTQSFTLAQPLQEEDTISLVIWHGFAREYIEQIEALPFLQVHRLEP